MVIFFPVFSNMMDYETSERKKIKLLISIRGNLSDFKHYQRACDLFPDFIVIEPRII